MAVDQEVLLLGAHSRCDESVVGELQSACERGITIFAIRYADDSMLRNPAPDQTIQAGDTLFIVTDHSNRISLLRVTQLNRPEVLYRGSRIQ